MACTWLRAASHVERSPRLTLKAGRKEGYKAAPLSSETKCNTPADLINRHG